MLCRRTGFGHHAREQALTVVDEQGEGTMNNAGRLLKDDNFRKMREEIPSATLKDLQHTLPAKHIWRTLFSRFDTDCSLLELERFLKSIQA